MLTFRVCDRNSVNKKLRRSLRYIKVLCLYLSSIHQGKHVACNMVNTMVYVQKMMYVHKGYFTIITLYYL